VARTVNETTIDPVTRKQKRKGDPIKHKLGDIVLVDCNVKRSDNCTPSDPKFALRTLWETIILPAYDALTAPGGPAEGAVVVHQEDNAPPHQEGDFHAWLTAEFDKRGWRLELQAPQVLTLTCWTYRFRLLVFNPNPNAKSLPNHNYVSFRYSLLCPSSIQTYCRCSTIRLQDMVSRAFVLAYRIMRKIIEENGNNAWLCHGTPHCCVRRDFVDTYDGIQPCQVYVPTVAVKLDDIEGFSIEF
jgi:hypothetical protein